jgi:hypothetical protein
VVRRADPLPSDLDIIASTSFAAAALFPARTRILHGRRRIF